MCFASFLLSQTQKMWCLPLWSDGRITVLHFLTFLNNWWIERCENGVTISEWHFVNHVCCMHVVFSFKKQFFKIQNFVMCHHVCLWRYDAKYITLLWWKIKWLPWQPGGKFRMAPYLKVFRALNCTKSHAYVKKWTFFSHIIQTNGLSTF